MASLRDVADRAGVSVATASRVVTGSAGVREETRRRVEHAMRELLYLPPGRQQETKALGLLVPEFGNPIFAALAQAIETRATRAGYAAILCNTAGSAQRELEYVHMLLERSVDGMMFISGEVTDVRGEHDHYGKLLQSGARMVFVNGGPEHLDVTTVGVDERAAGRMATEHLIEFGHRRIGFVAGESYAQPTREKLRGRNDALEAAGLFVDGDVAHDSFSVEGGRRALRRLLESTAGRPTAVICSSDLMAIGALQEARAAGLGVPRDLSIVGFDGTEAATWTQPPLTTVEQPIDEIASTAVEALRRLIAEPEAAQPSYVFRPRLVRGGTTAPPPAT